VAVVCWGEFWVEYQPKLLGGSGNTLVPPVSTPVVDRTLMLMEEIKELTDNLAEVYVSLNRLNRRLDLELIEVATDVTELYDGVSSLACILSRKEIVPIGVQASGPDLSGPGERRRPLRELLGGYASTISLAVDIQRSHK
jgi:hypothetical protein